MKSLIPFLESHIEPWFKLQMFRALPRYNIVELTVVRLKEESYYRSFCKIADKEQKLYFEGMAEGLYPLVAQLRALAEAYERSCLKGYFGSSVTKMGEGRPYGAGVGFRRSSAIIRAYGEFHERKSLTKLAAIEENRIFKIATPYGEIYVAGLRFEDGTLGTGYGLLAKEAKDSAYRSALRKKSYSVERWTFHSVDSDPEVVCITPKNGGWLECYFVGLIVTN